MWIGQQFESQSLEQCLNLNLAERCERIRSIWPRLSRGEWMSETFRPRWATVLVTAYQREKYIVRLADSVLRQTYRPIEFIVIDDGSTDNTKKALKAWSEKIPDDDQFEFTYEYQENTGAPMARNQALARSSGEFIQEIGSDDLIHPSKLQLHIDSLKANPGCQSAWSPLRRFEDSEESSLFGALDIENLVKAAPEVSVSSNIFVPQFFPSAGLHRRSVFFHAGPWMENLARWQDLEYQVRMAFCINSYTSIDEPLYYFRQHDGERIHSQYKQKRGLQSGFRSLDRVEKALGLMQHSDHIVDRELSRLYFSLAILAADCGEIEEFDRALDKALTLRPETGFQIRTKFYRFACKLLGGKFGNKLYNSYSTIQTR
jgi:glycosyltransferase involved in cell wall biosynthesis